MVSVIEKVTVVVTVKFCPGLDHLGGGGGGVFVGTIPSDEGGLDTDLQSADSF